MEKYNQLIAYNDFDMVLSTDEIFNTGLWFYAFNGCNTRYDCIYYNIYAKTLINVKIKFDDINKTNR